MRLAPHNPAGEASEGRDQSAGYARRSHSHAIADVGSIPTVSIFLAATEASASISLHCLESSAHKFEHLVERPHRLLVADRLAGLCLEKAVAHRGEGGGH